MQILSDTWGKMVFNRLKIIDFGIVLVGDPAERRLDARFRQLRPVRTKTPLLVINTDVHTYIRKN